MTKFYVEFLENREIAFFRDDINDNIPKTAKKIKETEYNKFFENQANGIRQTINPNTLKVEENPYSDDELKEFKIEEIKCQLALIDNNSNSRRSYREAVINKDITVNKAEYNAIKTIEDEAIALRQELVGLN